MIKNTQLAQVLSTINPPEPFETEHKSLTWEEENSMVNLLRNPEEVQDNETQAVSTSSPPFSRELSIISSCDELSEKCTSDSSTQDSLPFVLLEQRDMNSQYVAQLLETLIDTNDLYEIDNSEETQLKGYLSDASAELFLREEDDVPAAAHDSPSIGADYLKNGPTFVTSTERCAALVSRNYQLMHEVWSLFSF